MQPDLNEFRDSVCRRPIDKRFNKTAGPLYPKLKGRQNEDKCIGDKDGNNAYKSETRTMMHGYGGKNEAEPMVEQGKGREENNDEGSSKMRTRMRRIRIV